MHRADEREIGRECTAYVFSSQYYNVPAATRCGDLLRIQTRIQTHSWIFYKPPKLVCDEDLTSRKLYLKKSRSQSTISPCIWRHEMVCFSKGANTGRHSILQISKADTLEHTREGLQQLRPAAISKIFFVSFFFVFHTSISKTTTTSEHYKSRTSTNTLTTHKIIHLQPLTSVHFFRFFCLHT